MALPCVPLLFDAEGSFPPQQELRHPKCSAQAGRGGRDEGLADTELRARGKIPAHQSRGCCCSLQTCQQAPGASGQRKATFLWESKDLFHF